MPALASAPGGIAQGLGHQNIEPWVTFSPRNQEAVRQAAERMFADNARNLMR